MASLKYGRAQEKVDRALIGSGIILANLCPEETDNLAEDILAHLTLEDLARVMAAKGATYTWDYPSGYKDDRKFVMVSYCE